jgi:plastocyanin
VTKHLRIFAPLLAAAAFAAGCGGSSNTTGDGYGAPAKAAATTAPAAPAQTPAKTPAQTPAQTPAEKAGTATVEMTNTTFSPQAVDVKVGDSVTFVNRDEIAHTATANDGSFDSKTLDNGGTFTFKATKAGKIDYVCIFHPGMTGTINVTA